MLQVRSFFTLFEAKELTFLLRYVEFQSLLLGNFSTASLIDKGDSKESGCERSDTSELFIAHEYRTQMF